MMAEDILAHEDANIEDPPLHIIDTVKVAEYISQNFSKPILAKFAEDLSVDKSNAGEAFFAIMRRLEEVVRDYFRSAAGKLREDIGWVWEEWVELDVKDEIVGSDAQINSQVCCSHLDLTGRTEDPSWILHWHYANGMKVIYYLMSLISVHVYRYELDTLEHTKSLKLQVAKFSMDSISSTTLLRDIMFLDSSDLIVVASEDSIPPFPHARLIRR